LIAAVLGAAANWLYKKAALRFFEIPVWKNLPFFLGILCFVLVLVLFIAAFRNGGRLLVVYPAYATTYIWALVLASVVEREPISPWQIGGILSIILGVCMIGLGARA
jgi:drug/metabolite transporter (DMT)-like permease